MRPRRSGSAEGSCGPGHPSCRPSAKAYRRGGASWRGPMRRSYRTQSFHPPYPGLHPGLVCRAPLGHPLESSTALSRLVEALLSAVRGQAVYAVRTADWGQAVCAGWTGFGDRLLGVGGSRVGLRGIEPALAGRLGGRALLSRCARGGWVIASNARFGSVPLLPGDRPRGGTGCWEGRAAGRDGLLGGRQMF